MFDSNVFWDPMVKLLYFLFLKFEPGLSLFLLRREIRSTRVPFSLIPQ